MEEIEKITAGRRMPAFVKIVNQTGKEIEIYEVRDNEEEVLLSNTNSTVQAEVEFKTYIGTTNIVKFQGNRHERILTCTGEANTTVQSPSIYYIRENDELIPKNTIHLNVVKL